MQIHDIKRKTKRAKSRQVGRGGKRGKTSGRGTKGQKARAGRKLRPEIRDMIKKLPKLRGRGVNSNKPIGSAASSVNVALLETYFSAGETVTRKALLEKKLVRRVGGRLPEVKILGGGSLTKKLSISGCVVSASAKEKIEAVGGSLK